MGTTENELSRKAREQRETMSGTLEAIGDRVSPERMVERRRAAVGQGFKRARESVMGSRDYQEPMLARAREQAGEKMQVATERVQRAPEMLRDQTRGNPLAAGLVSFGAGLLLATLFPETETEHRLVDAAQPQIQRATEELKDAGRDIAQQAKEHGQEATEELRSATREAAGNVKDQASSTS